MDSSTVLLTTAVCSLDLCFLDDDGFFSLALCLLDDDGTERTWGGAFCLLE